MTNKEKTVALLKALETGDPEPMSVISRSQYIQHNLTAKDGFSGLKELLGIIPPNSVKVNTLRVFQDGDYVFAHTEYDFFGPKAGFDIFRFEGDHIVEHWDNLQEITGPNPSGHTMFDGSVEITDIEKTAANKHLVKSLVQDVLMGQNPEKLASYFDGDSYIQHNPAVGDGLSGLQAALRYMAENGIVMKYDRIHQVLGEGNFVLVVSEGDFAGNATAFYDLFRVENDRIAEHWDVVETILPESQRQNANGKF